MFSKACHGARDFLFKSFHKIYILDIILSTINNALDKCVKFDRIMTVSREVLPPFQIIKHSKNLGESNFFMFDQIYIIK